MEPTYDERKRLALQRLEAVLAPMSNREQLMVDWLLSSLIAIEADEWSDMVERAVNIARAEGYERGWAEGVEHGKTGGQP